MKIPVFVSCPTALNPHQEEQRQIIISKLTLLNLEPRALGRSDYPTDLPLREVLVIAKHCAGGIILGFNQFTSSSGVVKPGTNRERKVDGNTPFPTEWNNLEAGILFALQKPLLVFKETGVTGGVFDAGVTDVFVHNMPEKEHDQEGITEVFLKWRGKVGSLYYGWGPINSMP